MATQTKESSTLAVPIRLSREVWRKIAELAEKEDRSRAWIVRRLISKALEDAK